MATKKISDFFNQFSNPSGGYSILQSPAKSFASLASPNTQFSSLQVPAVPPQAPPLNLPGGSLKALAGTTPVPGSTVIAPPKPVAPVAPVAPAAPLFAGASPSAAPVGPQGATGAAPAAQPPVPPQWLNSDGTFKSPDQIAGEVGSTLQSAHGNGDIGNLAVAQFGGNNDTTAESEAKARQINNTRNDIAVGATDPYGVASQSGIAYTPQELSAIEKAYAGVYDPALDTALAKVTDKQATDKAKAASDAQANQPFTLGKDDVRYDGQGNPIAVGVSSTSGTSGTYTAGQDPTADAWVKFVQNGGAITAVPDLYKDSVAQGLAAVSTSGQLSKTSLDALGIINQLQNDPGIDSLTGQGFIGAVEHPTSLFPGTQVQNSQNLAKQLQATLSLANRQQLKGQGAISDFEFKVLGDASTALGLDGSGRTNLSADQFKDQLGKLELKLSVGPLKTLTDDQVQYLASPAGGSATPDEIRALDEQSSFKDVGNTTASTGNIPQRNNNPGNVKSGGVADSLATGKDKYGHLIFPNAQAGFQALALDVGAKLKGTAKLPANPTIAQLGSVYAEDPNWPKSVAKILGVPVDTHTQTVPLDKLIQAIAHQEGFYA